MTDLIQRLKNRAYSSYNLTAIGGAACAAAVAAPAPVLSFTTTAGGPDKDMVDAVAEIERLRADKERLEWIADNINKCDVSNADEGSILEFWPRTGGSSVTYEGASFRAVIDAARKAFP